MRRPWFRFVLAAGLLAAADPGHAQTSTFQVGLALSSFTRVGVGRIVVGDFDRDGHPDHAFTHATLDSFRVALGDGAGGMLPAVSYPTPDDPRALAAADFNGDGRLDLAIVCAGDSVVAYYPGLPLGRFGPRLVYPVARGPESIALGDFDGDSKLDLVVGPSGTDGRVTILRGNGSGDFPIRTDLVIPGLPRSVACADLDGDGRSDLVVGLTNAYKVLCFPGDGAGGFGAAIESILDVPGEEIVLGDLDQDGDLDVAATSIEIDAVGWSYGSGDGSFSGGGSVPTSADPSSPRIVDLTRDGLADIVFATGADLRLLRADGGGGFAAATATAMGAPVLDLVCTDLTDDGWTDIALARASVDGLHVVHALGEPPLRDSTGYAVPAAPAVLRAVDLDGDGDLDLAGLGYFASAMWWLPGDGLGGFGTRIDVPLGNAPSGLDFADVDGDGDQDMATLGGIEDSVAVRLNQGNGTFGPRRGFRTGFAPGVVLFGRVNPDTIPDLVVLNGGGFSASTMFGVGDGTFTVGLEPAAGTNPINGELADVDGDGDRDIVVLNQPTINSALVRILVNDGTGLFPTFTAFSVTARASDLSFGDLDGDGDLDFVLGHGGGAVTVLLRQSNGTYTTRVEPTIGSSAVEVELADFDADGRLDLFIAGGDGNLHLRRGDGRGGFGPVRVLSGIGEARSIVVAPLDGDPRLDFAGISAGPERLLVRLDRPGTTTTLAVDPDPCPLGTPLALAATVASPEGAPPGDVRFFDGTTLLGTAPLVGGVANLELPAPYPWSRTLRAVYLGAPVARSSASRPRELLVHVPTVGVDPIDTGEHSPAFALAPIAPNPVTAGELAVRFTLPSAGATRIDLVDVAGRRVGVRTYEAAAAGAHVVRLARPSGLGAGLYFVRVTHGGASRSARVLLL